MTARVMLEGNVAGRRRVARKKHHCDERRDWDGCVRTIQPGDVYLEVTLFPGHDTVPVARPTRYAQCAKCSLDRIDLLDPISYAQLAKDGLL